MKPLWLSLHVLFTLQIASHHKQQHSLPARSTIMHCTSRELHCGASGSTPPIECLFDRLSVEEVQSVMHMLDRGSLLRLARCSHRMWSDADSKHAWKWMAPFHIYICMHMPKAELLARLRTTRLLAHLGSSVRWSSGPLQLVPASEVAIHTILTIPRIERMDIDVILDIQQRMRLFSDPALVTLKHLTLGSENQSPPPAGFLRTLSCLPNLRRLRIRQPPDEGDQLEEIKELTNLRSLTYVDSSARVGANGLANTCAPSIAQCKNLTELHIHLLAVHSGQFRSLFCSPDLSFRLKRLSLTRFSAGRPLFAWLQPRTPIQREEFIEAFRALKQLAHLTFIDTSDLDIILPCVPYLTALAHLTIRRETRSYQIDAIPVKAIRAMLTMPANASMHDAVCTDVASSSSSSLVSSSFSASSTSSSSSRLCDNLNSTFRVQLFAQRDTITTHDSEELKAIRIDTNRLNINYING